MKLILLVALTAGISIQSSQKPESQTECPGHAANAQMNERGEKAMGFSQTATTHHFLLNAKGGVIQVEAKDSADAANRNEIRMHLGHIAKAFQSGDFDIPMFVHDTVPPGVPEMKRFRKKIQYSFEETPDGARVAISSANKEAVDAIHRFLRFQIKDPMTGDHFDDRCSFHTKPAQQVRHRRAPPPISRQRTRPVSPPVPNSKKRRRRVTR